MKPDEVICKVGNMRKDAEDVVSTGSLVTSLIVCGILCVAEGHCRSSIRWVNSAWFALMIFVPGGVEDIDWSSYTSWLLGEPVRSSSCNLCDQNKHNFMNRKDYWQLKCLLGKVHLEINRSSERQQLNNREMLEWWSFMGSDVPPPCLVNQEH